MPDGKAHNTLNRVFHIQFQMMVIHNVSVADNDTDTDTDNG